jgi:uncharacterized protein (TIGR03089 family)
MHQLSASPEQLFADLLAAAPAAPFVTYYDERSGERAELSARSLGNWVAKTHFLLIDELGLSVGSAALVALPAHWISVPAVLGCLTAGLQLVEDAARADVAFVAPATLARATGIDDVFAVAPESAATGFAGEEPDGATDYVRAVRPQPDKWPTVHFPAGPDDPCLAGRTRREVADHARERAAQLGVDRGARVLTDRDWRTAADLIDTLFLPLAVGGSLVLVRNASDEVLARRAEQERASVVLR